MDNNEQKKIISAYDKSVAAVVVTYNRKQLLKECIEALLAQKEKHLRIFIIDNASTDGTEEYVKGLIDGERVVYLNTGENLGGAGGFCFGIKEAMKSDCDYVWLMDDDCIVHPDSLDKLLECADKLGGDFGFLSGVARWTDDEICEMNVQRISVWRMVKNFTVPLQRIRFASFVSLFLSRQAVLTCGLPIKEFFIWGDDWEYTSRISKKFKNYLAGESVVTHKSETNVGSNIVADTSDRLNRYFYAYRNESYLFNRLGISGKLYYAAKIPYHRLKLALSDVPDKKERFAIIKKGLKAAKTFKPEIEYV